MNPIPIRLANRRHLCPEAIEDASALEEPTHGPDECVVVGFDDCPVDNPNRVDPRSVRRNLA